VNWVDEDLPLSFRFAFFSHSTGHAVTLRSQSEVPYASAMLPAGSPQSKSQSQSDSGNGVLLCVAEVFDAYDANNSAVTNVTVTTVHIPMAQIRHMAQQNSNSGIGGSSGSADDMLQTIATIGSYLGAVNCSGAPSCTNYNRARCRNTPDTCGGCLGGYTGIPFDSNSLCVSAAVPSSPSSGTGAGTGAGTGRGRTKQPSMQRNCTAVTAAAVCGALRRCNDKGERQ